MLFKIKSLMLATLLLSAHHSLAQSQKDAEGNPVVAQQFVEDVIQPMEFQTINGESKTLKVADFDGKIVIIDFWQTWCGPCLTGFKGFQKAKEAWPERIAIIAASPDWADKKRKIKRFMKKHPYDFHFVWAGELEQQLSLQSIPYKIILAPDGSLIQSKSDSAGAEGEYELIQALVKQYFEEK